METKALKKQMGAAIAMVLVAAIALGAATFAWFVNNTKVTAQTAEVTATTANTLLISDKQDSDWRTMLPLSDKLENLVPVSTIGSDGADLSFVKTDEWTDSYATGFKAATSGQDYYATTFYLKGSVKDSKLYLDSDTSISNDVKSGASADALKSMRLALVVDGKTYIYQINDDHLTSAYNTSISSTTNDVDGVAKAIDSDFAAKAMNVDNKSKTVGVLPLATAPATANDFVTDAGDADLLYTFAESGSVVKVQAYVWMEGCDYDCNNAVVASITGQKLLANLGFAVANA